MTGFAPLLTPRLVLRRLQPADSETVRAYRANPEVARYQSWDVPDLRAIQAFSQEMATLPVNSPDTWFQLAIVLREPNVVIGDCGLHFLADDNQQVEIGITLNAAYQGQGYAMEALMAVLDYLFRSLNKHRVFASVDPRNHASIALLERVGMRREAHFRESLWFKGGWADDLVFAILEREWVK